MDIKLHHLIARYKTTKRWLREYDSRDENTIFLSKEKLAKKSELVKSQIMEYLMRDDVYERTKALNI
jgi:hypothetical protein